MNWNCVCVYVYMAIDYLDSPKYAWAYLFEGADVCLIKDIISFMVMSAIVCTTDLS